MNKWWKPLEPWLRQIMAQRQWTIADWTERAGLAHSTLSRAMNNPKHRSAPTLKTIRLLATVAGVPVPFELLNKVPMRQPKPKAKRTIIEQDGARFEIMVKKLG